MTAPPRSRWLDVIAQVPREGFIPDVVYRHEWDRPAPNWVPVSRVQQPALWRRLVDAEDYVITQVDDGHPSADGSGYTPTSSASNPVVVAEMLDCLDLHPGHRVLEIGTGTGWNAALMASVVGAENVTSVEIDREVADHARRALAGAGFDAVSVITGDGEAGWASTAPYDRVIATVGVYSIPGPWVTQTTLGGRLVVPLSNHYQHPGIAVLQRTRTGAYGRLAGRAVFMPLRAHRHPRISDGDWERAEQLPTTDSTTDQYPQDWISDRDAATAIGQRIPDIITDWQPDGDDAATGTLWLRTPDVTSWATLRLTDTPPPYRIEQAGPRKLLDEVAAAYQWWLDQRRPTVADWRISVDLTGEQRIELVG